MHLRTLLCSSLLAALVASPLAAEADGFAKPHGEHGEHAGHGNHDERADTDGDGTLSDEEKAAVKDRLAQHHDGERREELKERFDTNGDGTIDESEREAAKATMQDRLAQRVEKIKSEHPELFAKLDRNGDGELSMGELRSAKAMRHRHQHGDHGRGDRPERGAAD